MDSQKFSRPEQVEWFKWLRYYLDFCHKYQHSTRNPETEILYLQKLSSKGQSNALQKQASDCITMFREVAKRFPARGKEQDQGEELSDWEGFWYRLRKGSFFASTRGRRVKPIGIGSVSFRNF